MAETTREFKGTGFRQVGLIEIPQVFYQRFATGIESIDTLLGGQGFLPGSSFTVTGKAGAGKTTFLLQMLEALQTNGKMTGYASGEESIHQIAYNAKRLEIERVQIANITDVDQLVEAMAHLDVLIIDSFQFLTCSHITKPLMIQRYAIKKLVEAAQKHECVLGIIQHLTQGGIAKGGTHVPHTVDMNMEIETDECDENLKIVRVYKNRFGRIGEIKLVMNEKGFDFTQVVSVEKSPKMSKALKKGEKEKAQILEYLKTHKKANLDQLHKAVGATWRVAHFLRILTNEDKITKEGRGEETFWKITQ